MGGEGKARHISSPKTYNMERNKLHTLWMRQGNGIKFKCGRHRFDALNNFQSTMSTVKCE